MKIVLQIMPWFVLLLSFIVLAFFYNSIPNKVLIARSFFGDEATLAPKTLFTVFRVPLIEIICAAAIEVMRQKFANVNADYYSMWNILLYTVSIKSLLQACEIVSSNSLFYYLTLGVVIIGIILAIFKGRKFFSNFFRGDFKFSGAERAIFVIILIAYLGLAIVPIFVFG